MADVTLRALRARLPARSRNGVTRPRAGHDPSAKAGLVDSVTAHLGEALLVCFALVTLATLLALAVL